MSAFLGVMIVLLVAAVPAFLVDLGAFVPEPAAHPPGTAVLADAAAAKHVARTHWEMRQGNAQANRVRPTPAELARFRTASQSPYARLVTGGFSGTTDEILQWGAAKWGLDVDLLRAQAAQESGSRQSQVGDNGLSFGILQIKRTAWDGTWPLTQRSTAFNVDMHGAIMRECLDGGATWLESGYRAGDLWGCVGYYFSGRWDAPEGEAYAERVRRQLRSRFLRDTWLQDS